MRAEVKESSPGARVRSNFVAARYSNFLIFVSQITESEDDLPTSVGLSSISSFLHSSFENVLVVALSCLKVRTYQSKISRTSAAAGLNMSSV